MLIYRNAKGDHVQRKVANPFYNLGFSGTLGGCIGCSLVMSAFCVLRHKADSWPCDQTLPLCKNASAIVVTESETSNQFMLTVFFMSVVLRMKLSFNKSEVIAL